MGKYNTIISHTSNTTRDAKFVVKVTPMTRVRLQIIKSKVTLTDGDNHFCILLNKPVTKQN